MLKYSSQKFRLFKNGSTEPVTEIEKHVGTFIKFKKNGYGRHILYNDRFRYYYEGFYKNDIMYGYGRSASGTYISKLDTFMYSYTEGIFNNHTVEKLFFTSDTKQFKQFSGKLMLGQDSKSQETAVSSTIKNMLTFMSYDNYTNNTVHQSVADRMPSNFRLNMPTLLIIFIAISSCAYIVYVFYMLERPVLHNLNLFYSMVYMHNREIQRMLNI